MLYSRVLLIAKVKKDSPEQNCGQSSLPLNKLKKQNNSVKKLYIPTAATAGHLS